MTKDPNDTPPPHDPDAPERAPDAPQPAPRRARAGRIVAWTLVTIVLLAVLAAGLVLAAATTERGTRLAWQTAVRVLGGRLT
ncbi:hypothetical protein, partial [Burkholderia territorii]